MARRIVLLAFEGVQSLDVAGPLEVFSAADRLSGRPSSRYTLEVASPGGGSIRTSSGLGLDTTALTVGPVDTLIVAGGEGVERASADAAVLEAVRLAAGRARRVASVCTGAFVLAAAGLLDGRRATTHWASADRMAHAYPTVTVEPDRIFVRDGHVWTSAGVTAGIDLALELVATDHGRAVAADVARWLVVYLHRTGGQTQFSAGLAAAPSGRDAVRELHAWMTEHPSADLSVAALAERCGMAPRTFQRVVRRDLGMTAGDLVEEVRIDAARRALEGSDLAMAAVARRSGFRSVSTLYRAFDRTVGVTPAAYRRHFRTGSETQSRPHPLDRRAS
jgi:transcriptional regulator GlxA family with amidase domain